MSFRRDAIVELMTIRAPDKLLHIPSKVLRLERCIKELEEEQEFFFSQYAEEKERVFSLFSDGLVTIKAKFMQLKADLEM